MKSFPFGFWLFMTISIFSCKEEAGEYPLIYTGGVTDISEDGAVFHAKITDVSKESIQEYGFVWGTDELPDLSSSNLIISDPPVKGVLSATITNDLIDGEVYYVRAFARNSKFITYGQQVSFTSMGSMAPVITDFNPKQGTGGTRVVIEGDNFSNIIDKNAVWFGKVIAIIDSASKNKLIVTLPNSLDISGIVEITLSTSGRVIKASEEFYLEGVLLKSVIPNAEIGGNIISLSVENYDSEVTGNKVKIGEIEAEITSIEQNAIYVRVPFNAKTGISTLSITVDSKTCTLENSFYVKTPWGKMENSNSFYRYGAAALTIGNLGYYGFGYAFNFYETKKDFWAFDAASDVWEQKTSFPGEVREDVIYFGIAENAYIGSGNNRGTEFFSDFYQYNTQNDSWSLKTSFPGVKRTNALSIVIGNKGYYGMGVEVGAGTTLPLKDFWEYDPELDQWTKLTDFPGTTGSAMTGFTINNKGYIGLGMGEFRVPNSNEFWEYDPLTNEWKGIADFPGPERRAPTSFSIGNLGYVVMGEDLNSIGNILNDAWRYEPNTNEWIRVANVPYQPFRNGTCFVLNNHCYLIAGEVFGYQQDNFESFITFNPLGN